MTYICDAREPRNHPSPPPDWMPQNAFPFDESPTLVCNFLASQVFCLDRGRGPSYLPLTAGNRNLKCSICTHILEMTLHTEDLPSGFFPHGFFCQPRPPPTFLAGRKAGSRPFLPLPPHLPWQGWTMMFFFSLFLYPPSSTFALSAVWIAYGQMLVTIHFFSCFKGLFFLPSCFPVSSFPSINRPEYRLSDVSVYYKRVIRVRSQPWNRVVSLYLLIPT